MYEIPSWKLELKRRLAAIRERLGGDFRALHPALSPAHDGARRSARVSRSPLELEEEKRKWRP